jgi:hypothetical protein
VEEMENGLHMEMEEGARADREDSSDHPSGALGERGLGGSQMELGRGRNPLG